LSDTLVQIVSRFPGGTIRKLAEDPETQLLIKWSRLEAVRIEEDAHASPTSSLVFSSLDKLGADAGALVLRLDPQGRDKEPTKIVLTKKTSNDPTSSVTGHYTEWLALPDKALLPVIRDQPVDDRMAVILRENALSLN
jgi:hypothetical protein